MEEEKNLGGRPPVDIDDYFAKIRPFLEFDCSLHEACLQASVPYTTCWDYYQNDESFRNKVDTAKNLVIVKARNNVVRQITGWKEKKIDEKTGEVMKDKDNKDIEITIPGDVKLSWEYLQNKRSNEFNKKLKFDGSLAVSEGNSLQKYDKIIKQACAEIPQNDNESVYFDPEEDSADESGLGSEGDFGAEGESSSIR